MASDNAQDGACEAIMRYSRLRAAWRAYRAAWRRWGRPITLGLSVDDATAGAGRPSKREADRIKRIKATIERPSGPGGAKPEAHERGEMWAWLYGAEESPTPESHFYRPRKRGRR